MSRCCSSRLHSENWLTMGLMVLVTEILNPINVYRRSYLCWFWLNMSFPRMYKSIIISCLCLLKWAHISRRTPFLHTRKESSSKRWKEAEAAASCIFQMQRARDPRSANTADNYRNYCSKKYKYRQKSHKKLHPNRKVPFKISTTCSMSSIVGRHFAISIIYWWIF